MICCCNVRTCCFRFLVTHTTFTFSLSSHEQHFAVLLKYIIHVAIPDIPSWVGEEMAKLEFQRKEAFKVIPIPRLTETIFKKLNVINAGV